MENFIETTNPYTNTKIKKYKIQNSKDVLLKLQSADNTFLKWKETAISKRINHFESLALLLKKKKRELSELMSIEMGKPINQSVAEIEKCIKLIDFYCINAEHFLADEIIKTDAQESFISYDPLGVILAIMPWNYPFWQVFRFAVPTVMAGNTALLKHASNVTGCALAIESLFKEAGFPDGCFSSLICKHETIEEIIADEKVKAVSLTGSEKAGKKIAEHAGKYLKKCVLELGGNNACIILKDANLDTYMPTIFNARMQNSGQSCIAAKRFIIERGIYNEFLDRFKDMAMQLTYDDPLNKEAEIGPLARKDLAETLKKQVDDSIQQGAKLVYGNSIENAYYEPTIIEDVEPGMPVFDEETFGPVAAFTKVNNQNEAFDLASKSRFGLGTMVFTADIENVLKKTIHIEDGAYFINEMVKSDPRLPFGGTKASGYGRELSKEGIMEFVNKKTVYINKN